MKRIIFIFIALFLITVNFSFAQTPSEEPTPTSETKEDNNMAKDVQDKIEDLKERLATRVAEIRSKSKKAFYGTIAEKDDITFTVKNGDAKIAVVIDDQTNIEMITASGRNTIDASTIEVGDKIAAFGILDLDQKTILAKYVLMRSLPITIYGKVKEIDQNKGVITVSDVGGEDYQMDYEIRTKCVIWNKEENKIASCGLSKINQGDLIFVRIQEGSKKGNYTILRILNLPSAQPQAQITEAES